ncbi:MAG: hypothetical protein ACTTJO_00285 [Metamycoplasmataceae bacterium]
MRNKPLKIKNFVSVGIVMLIFILLLTIPLFMKNNWQYFGKDFQNIGDINLFFKTIILTNTLLLSIGNALFKPSDFKTIYTQIVELIKTLGNDGKYKVLASLIFSIILAFIFLLHLLILLINWIVIFINAIIKRSIVGSIFIGIFLITFIMHLSFVYAASIWKEAGVKLIVWLFNKKLVSVFILTLSSHIVLTIIFVIVAKIEARKRANKVTVEID